ncbi:MAG: hypothetical protein ACTSUE_17045 [Promethearchaeota archaeon]
MAKKTKEILSHPGTVKLMSVVSTIFIISSLAWNGYQFAAGFMLDWGFANSPNKFQPNITAQFNTTGTNDVLVNIPVYVNNTAAIGFDVKDLVVDFNINYAVNGTNIVGNDTAGTPINIPRGSTLTFNVTILQTNDIALFNILNSTAVQFEIIFKVSYIVTTTNLNLTIDLPGGLSFT